MVKRRRSIYSESTACTVCDCVAAWQRTQRLPGDLNCRKQESSRLIGSAVRIAREALERETAWLNGFLHGLGVNGGGLPPVLEKGAGRLSGHGPAALCRSRHQRDTPCDEGAEPFSHTLSRPRAAWGGDRAGRGAGLQPAAVSRVRHRGVRSVCASCGVGPRPSLPRLPERGRPLSQIARRVALSNDSSSCKSHFS